MITEAFAATAYSDGNEAQVARGLREAGALTVSLVAEQAERLIGHIAFSPVLVDGKECGWFGLGPVAVAPAKWGAGIGSALVREGLARLEQIGAKGCVLLGDPGYYSRFGFAVNADLTLPGVPAEHFLALPLNGGKASGEISYHPAFYQD